MNDRLGNAQWEDQAVIARKYLYDPHKFWLGRGEDQAALGYADDRHICLVSGTRGGKGTSIIINNLCLWPGSAVVIDPKGENATVTAARRGSGNVYCEGLGQVVHALDPFNAARIEDSYRSAFNPLDALDADREETIDEAARLANALIVVKDDRADPFFDESARSMVQALILHVVSSPDFEAQERTLLMVRQLLKRGEWRIAELMREQAAEDGTEVEDSPSHELLWRSLEMNSAFGGVVAGDGSRFLSMMRNSPKTFESVLQAAIINTDFLDSPGMRRVLAKSDFKLSELKTRREGMTLYLSLPQRYMDTHYRWLRMMVALTTAEMEVTRGRPATGHPVLMVLDEFAGLKRMTSIENAVAQLAGFGVKLLFVLQSLEQLKFTYKDNWETFLSNAGLKIFFSIEDHFTRDYVSKLIGETEIVRELQSRTEGQSTNESLAEGTSQSETVSRSTTRGTSVSHTTGTSQTTTRGRSRGLNVSQTEGTNQSQSQTVGTSTGVNYRKRPFLFFWEVVDTLSISYSNGSSVSNSTSTGTSSSLSRGTSEGTSESEAAGHSQSTTRGTSYSETAGTSQTTGTSQTRTRGTSTSTGQGRAESLHKRLLLPPDELGRLFARIDDPQHPAYPGFALTLTTGGHPFPVHRRHYFEDAQFIDCFSPHPDHEFWPAAEEQVRGIEPLLDQLEAAKGGPLMIAQWLIRKGDVVTVDGPAARIEDVPPDNRTVHLRVPASGKTSYVGVSTDERGGPGRVPRGVLYTVKHYVDDSQMADPFAELRAACAALARPPEPQPLPRQPQPRLWVPRVGAACLALSAATYIFLVATFQHYLSVGSESNGLSRSIYNSGVTYYGLIWGGLIAGMALLWFGRRHLKKPARALSLLVYGILAVQAVIVFVAIWWLGTSSAGASFFANLADANFLLQFILWQPVVLGLYWLLFRRMALAR